MRSIGFKNLKRLEIDNFSTKKKKNLVSISAISNKVDFALTTLQTSICDFHKIADFFFQSSSNLTPSRENAWCMPYRHEIWGGLEKSWRVKCRMNHLKSSATLACTCTNYLIAVSSQRRTYNFHFMKNVKFINFEEKMT